MNQANMNIKKGYTRYIWALIALLMAVVFAPPVVLANDTPVLPTVDNVGSAYGRDCVEDEIIVAFEDASPMVQAQSMMAMDAQMESTAQDDTFVMQVPEGETVESFADEMAAQPGVKYAQPNYIYWLDAAVNDTFAGLQWHLDTINAHEAWDTTFGNAGVTVAVLDTGIDLDHPDFAGQTVTLRKELAVDNAADDDQGHGTHVSGIIAAATNNATGVAGISPDVTLMVIDVFACWYDPGTASWKWGASSLDIVDALDFAVTNGARVVNMSLGGYSADPIKQAAVDAAVAAGVVCVASAGNDNISNYHTPSDYDSCISVTSTDLGDTKSGFSNYGAEKDIAAPGSDIASTYVFCSDREADGNPATQIPDYVYMGGTSMAAPVVSAVAALILSINPALTVGQVKNILYGTAADIGDAGKDVYFGHGRVDAQTAVAAAAAYVPVTGVNITEEALTLEGNDTAALTVTPSPAGATLNTMEWTSSNETVATVSGGVITAVSTGTATITGTTIDGGFTDTVDVTVTLRVNGMTVDKDKLFIEAGGGAAVTASVSPANASNQNYTWASANTAVATVDAAGNVTAVADGETTLTATSEDGGYVATCDVYVAPLSIFSGVYTVDRAAGFIAGVAAGTTAAQFEQNLGNNDGYVYIYDAQGAAYSGSAVTTGMTAKLIIGGQEKDALGIVVRGECNGDAAINIGDYTVVRLDILDLKKLEGAYLEAADVNDDGVVNIGDYTLIRLHILGLKPLY